MGSMLRLVVRGVEAARQAEMAVRMDLDPVSQTPGRWPGPVIASSAPAKPAEREVAASGPRGHPVTPQRRPCSPRPETRGQGPGPAPGHGHQHGGLVAAVLPGPPRDRLCPLARHRGAGWPGMRWPRAVEQKRERVPLRGSERGCRLDQLPDPGIQEHARVVRGVPVVVVVLAAQAVSGRAGVGRPGTGASQACRGGSGFPLRC